MSKTNTETQVIKPIKGDENSQQTYNIWTIISLLELVIIIILIYKLLNSKNKKLTKKDEILNEKVDFDNLLNSSFNAKVLYDQLIRKCHPDRFSSDSNLNQIADNLFQEISKNKTNLKKLEELKKQAIIQLKIKM